MENDLHTVIRENILEPKDKQFIMYQIFKTLLFIHSAAIIHRDLKTSHFLINNDYYIKVCGLARCTDKDVVMTDFVATRWYRALEILFGSTKYGTKADIWSVGCIFCELLGGKPMFPRNKYFESN